MTKSTDHELIAAEKHYWDAMQHKNAREAMQLSDDRCIVVGSRGIAELDRETLEGMMNDASFELTRYSFDDRDVHIRKLTEDVAIVAYKVREDLVVDGKPESLTAFDASVWVRRGKAWVCALHTESPQGDPFGRCDLDLEHFAGSPSGSP